MSSLRRGHAHLLCIVPIFAGDLFRGSACSVNHALSSAPAPVALRLWDRSKTGKKTARVPSVFCLRFVFVPSLFRLRSVTILSRAVSIPARSVCVPPRSVSIPSAFRPRSVPFRPFRLRSVPFRLRSAGHVAETSARARVQGATPTIHGQCAERA